MYDAAGHTTSWTGDTFTFNDRGRLTAATVSGVNNTYTYDALGQLIYKVPGAGGATILMYDEADHIIGEYSSTGALIEETVWMGDVPVATLRPNGSTGCTTTPVCVFYVHTDHRNAPRKISQPSSNSLVWRWDPWSFGNGPSPNQNPAGVGTFVYHLEYPGQYGQTETGLVNNHFRDYMTSAGRYVESDPIGSRAGVNTYAYVHENPISRSDRLGLHDSICMFNPSMCGMQGNANPNEPSAVAEIMVAEGAIVAALVAPEAVAALERALSLTPKELPPPGTKPPVANPEQCKVGPSTRGDGSSTWDPNGGEWRYAPEDPWHNPHWDYNPWENWNTPWQNTPIDGLPPVKPGP